MNTLEMRLDRLERSNRLWKRAAVCLMSALFTTLALGQARLAQKDVLAEKFTLVDANGKEWASLAMAANGEPTLAMFNAGGEPRVLLGVSPDGAAHLSLHNGVGLAQTDLGVAKAGEPSLLFFDGQEKMRGYLGVQKDGAPLIALLNKDEKRIVRVGLGDGGVPGISLSDEKGAGLRASLSAPGLFFYSPEAKPSIALSANPIGTGLVCVRDGAQVALQVVADGSVVLGLGHKEKSAELELSINAAGAPALKLTDKDGKQVLQVPPKGAAQDK
jgi:hypothetical protein